ncbi:MAG: branched-chain amino acid ABC transporter permease [Pseudomonadota bacterium]
MSGTTRNLFLFTVMALLIVMTGMLQSWNVALLILNMGMISAIMAIGVNLQWGVAGLFNVGIMGFVALGGLATVLIATAPIPGVWPAGGFRVLMALLAGAGAVALTAFVWRRMKPSLARSVVALCLLVVGFALFRWVFDPGARAVEALNPTLQGNIGGLGLPVLLAWPVGGALSAGAAWLIGKTALGLRSDYLAIATLGTAEIIIAILKNEDWLARGVKNVIGLPRPVPYEVDLQADAGFAGRAAALGFDPITASTLWVKGLYALLFAVVLTGLFWMAQRALHSPWGRMMRAIRDNEAAAAAMGKNVTGRHLQVFVLGSAICGLAGAMMTTLDGQLTPGSYQPLRFTFLIWVMVIVGGSGSNIGAVLGGFLIWFLWVQVEPSSLWLIQTATSGMPDTSPLKPHLTESAGHMRLLIMGIILLLVLRVCPRGLIPPS